MQCVNVSARDVVEDLKALKHGGRVRENQTSYIKKLYQRLIINYF